MGCRATVTAAFSFENVLRNYVHSAAGPAPRAAAPRNLSSTSPLRVCQGWDPTRVSCSDWLPLLSIASSGVTRTAAALGTPSFSWLCSIPLCGCTVFSPFVLHGWPTFGPLPPFSSRDSCCGVCTSERVSTLGPSAVTPEGRPAGPRARPAFRFSGTRWVGLR